MAIVRILPTEQGNLNSKMVTVDVMRKGKSERMVITAQRDLNMNMGESIRCISGKAVAMINPGTQAGAYVLTSQLHYGADSKHVTTLTISPDTLKIVPRGEIKAAEDIGTVMTATAAVSR